jgi:hypothetical protein
MGMQQAAQEDEGIVHIHCYAAARYTVAALQLASTYRRKVKLCLPDQLRSELVNAVAAQ